MKLLIDSSDISAITKLIDYYPIDGVTTNPSILAKSGRQPYEVLKEIRSLIGDMDLHVQVISGTAEGMKREAAKITEILGKNTYIKIPVVFEGVKAIKELSSEGYNCTGTAVYTVEQVYMAAKAGAKWVAPYVNRIEKLGNNGVETVRRMQEMLDKNGFETQILGASFHRIDQIAGLAEIAVGAATVSSDLLLTLLDNPNVDGAVSKFIADFESLCGKDSTMLS